MTATSTLLAALIAASTATNGVITVGDTQPFDQVRLYQNPANSTVLTNRSSDGSIDTSTTALVITGATAPTGLVFEPNLSVLRNVTSDIKLLVDTSVELTLNVNIAGTLTAMTVEAGKTAVLTLGLIAGIPMIVGAFGFFPVATDGNGAVGGLRFMPTGATEAADGEFQRFESGGAWSAQLAETDWKSSLQIQFYMPDVPEGESVSIIFGVGNDTSMPSYGAVSITEGEMTLQWHGDGGAPVALPIASDPPVFGGTIVLIVSATQATIAYSAPFSNPSATVDIPSDAIGLEKNCIVESSTPALSIKVAGA